MSGERGGRRVRSRATLGIDERPTAVTSVDELGVAFAVVEGQSDDVLILGPGLLVVWAHDFGPANLFAELQQYRLVNLGITKVGPELQE